jgi:hypothetical protein
VGKRWFGLVMRKMVSKWRLSSAMRKMEYGTVVFVTQPTYKLSCMGTGVQPATYVVSDLAVQPALKQFLL